MDGLTHRLPTYGVSLKPQRDRIEPWPSSLFLISIDFIFVTEEFLHGAQQYTQITPLEVEILFQVANMHEHTG